MKKIPLIKPYVTQEVKDKVCEVLDSGYLTEGPVTKELEDMFKDYLGCQHALADWMLFYKHFGMGVHSSRLTTNFDRIGTNYKLSDIQAAVGLVQMRHIEELLARRKEISERYYRLLSNTTAISFPRTTVKGIHLLKVMDDCQ